MADLDNRGEAQRRAAQNEQERISIRPDPSIAAAKSETLKILVVPRSGQEVVRLKDRERAELLASLSPERQAEFIREEKLARLRENLPSEDISLLRQSNLTDAELDRVAAFSTARFDRTLAPTPQDLAAALKLSSLTGFEQFALDKMTPDEIVGGLGAMTPAQRRQLDPFVEDRAMQKIAGDPNAVLRVQQMRYHGDNIALYESIRQGALTSEADSARAHGNAAFPAFLSNRTSGHALEKEGANQRALSAGTAVSSAQDVLDRSQSEQRVANLIRSVINTEDPARALELGERAAELFTQSSLTLHERQLRNFNSDAGIGQIRAAEERFASSAQNWDRGVRTMTTLRNGAVVVVAAGAATLAAPVVFSAAVAASGSVAIGFTGSIIAGTTVGSATGLGLGGLTTSLENAGHVAFGNKTGAEAIEDVIRQTQNDAYRGAMAGTGSGAAGGLAKILNAGGAQLATPILVRNGALQSAAASATSFSADTSLRIANARNEFAEKFKDSKLSEEKLGVEFAKHMKKQGLDWETLGQQGGMNLVVSTFFGATGGAFGAARNSASNQTVPRQAAIETSEWGLSTVIGFSRAYFETPEAQRTFDNLLQAAIDEAANNTVSSFQGRAAAGSSPAAAPPAPAELPPPRSDPIPGRDEPSSNAPGVILPTHRQALFVSNDSRLPPEGYAGLILPVAGGPTNRVFPASSERELVGAAVPHNDPLGAAIDIQNATTQTTTSAQNQGKGSGPGTSGSTTVTPGSGGNGAPPQAPAPTPEPSPLPGRILTDKEADRRIDSLRDNPSSLTVEEKAELARHLRDIELFDDIVGDFAGDQGRHLEASELVMRTMNDPELESSRAAVVESLVTIGQGADITLADASRLFAKSSPREAAERIQLTARLIAKGVSLDASDLALTPAATSRLVVAESRLNAKRTPDAINKELEGRKAFEKHLDKLVGRDEGARARIQRAVDRLMDNERFASAHSIQDIAKVMRSSAEGLKFTGDLAVLSALGVDGVDRVFGNVKKTLATNNGEVRGFFIEAEVALKLLRDGHEVHSMSAHLSNTRPLEIDIVATINGKLTFVEVKGSPKTFINKNSSTPSSAQVVLQAKLAEEFGAKSRVVIGNTHSLLKASGPGQATDQSRIESLMRSLDGQGLFTERPIVYDVRGNRIF